MSLSGFARIQIKVLGKLVENLRISPEKVQVKEVLGPLKLIFLQIRINARMRRSKIRYARTDTDSSASQHHDVPILIFFEVIDKLSIFGSTNFTNSL